MDNTKGDLVEAYCSRLGFPTGTTQLRPTVRTLQDFTERHLRNIPFENTSMHTTTTTTTATNEDSIVLSPSELIHKILVQRRGGCCLELNGLFAYFLRELGYTVRLVPCWISAGRERGHATNKRKFRVQQSHFILLVSVVVESDKKCDESHATPMTTPRSRLYLVDVGLGEPPCQPLRYSRDELGLAQTTPEGMTSRIVWDPRGTWVDGSGKKRTCLLLEWWQQTSQNRGCWEPRLQWDVSDAPFAEAMTSYDDGPSLESFRSVIPILTHPKSSFARKLVVCKLTRSEKVSLAGRVLKRTSPRFATRKGNPVMSKTLALSDEEVIEYLRDEFGIVLPTQVRIDFTASDGPSSTRLWEHL